MSRLRRYQQLLALVAAACAVALVAPQPSPARSKKGEITVRLRKVGGGRPAKTVRALRIVDASTGEVLLATNVRPNGTTALRPLGGVAFAIGTVARSTGTRTGVSRIFRFDPPKRGKIDVRLRPIPGRLNGASARRTSAAPGSLVATMGHVTISDGGYASSFGDAMFTDLFNATSDVITWVESSTGFIVARARELALQNEGRTDPSTHIDDRLIPPDVQIEGDLIVDPSGHATGEILLVDPRTGEVIERIPIDLDAESWRDLAEQIAKRIAEILRRRATTTTTTSTTTTSSSSSSSTTSTTPSSTTSTTGTPPTTTTLPSGRCRSVLPASFCECSVGGGVCTTARDCVLGGTCVDHVGPTLITFRFAGSGGRLGALQIATPNDTDFNDGLFDVNNGQGVGVLGGCGTPAFTQGTVYPLPLDRVSCAAYYHIGTEIVIQAAQNLTAAGAPGPGQPNWCNAVFSAFSGCAAETGCANGKCGCILTAHGPPETVTVTYTAVSGSCIEPAIP